MKKSKYNLTFILITLLITIMLLLSGCKPQEEPYVLIIGDKRLYLEDFMYDIYIVEQEGLALDQHYRRNNLLYDNYWDLEYDGKTMRDTARNNVLTRVLMYEILSDQALQRGYTLTPEEIAANQASVDNIVNAVSEQSLGNIGLSREILQNAYERISLGDKYYLELSKDFEVNEEAIRDSIDFNDFREYKTMTIFTPTVTTVNQVVTPLRQEDLAEALKAIEGALEKLRGGADFETVLLEDNRLASFSRDFIYGNTVFEQPYQDAAILLENGEISDIVSTNFGYYIILMIDNNSTDRYESAINDAIQIVINEQFEAAYNRLKAQYDISVNLEYWNTIDIGNITISTEN